jgi:hypothetical protein
MLGNAAFRPNLACNFTAEVLSEDADSINRFCRLHCYVRNSRDIACASKAKMHWHETIRSARVLVLASDRRTEMLVRRQAHAFEIIVGVACAGFRATEIRWRTRKRSGQSIIGFASLGNE